MALNMIIPMSRNSIITLSASRRTILLSCSNCVFYRNRSEITTIPDNIQILKPTVSSSSAALRIKTINIAMKAYLQRAQNYESFLQVKNDEYEIGRRHLANMMGLEAESLTQDDVDKAIAYLLPSGLYEKKARPMMKPPAEMFPREKAAQFDNSGRPFSPFFYTGKANFYAAIHEILGKFKELDDFEDKMIARGILEPPKEKRLSIVAGAWFSIDEMKELFLEKITDHEYKFMIQTLERLSQHPYSFRIKDDIFKFRKKVIDIDSTTEIPALKYDENGRPYMKAHGIRKFCHADVTVRGNGTGKFSINGTDIFFFPRLQDREQILYPLQFTNMLGKVDIEVDLEGIGGKAQSGAVRHGISQCLRSFVPQDAEKMRLAGLLTWDRRMRGRDKPGQKGCRAKYTWKKR